MTWQYVILISIPPLVVVFGCLCVAVWGLVKALEAQRDAVAANERLAKAAMDRILALKDYQAFALVKKTPQPPKRKHLKTVSLT